MQIVTRSPEHIASVEMHRRSLMHEEYMRRRVDRAETALSEYLIFVGSLCALAEDQTVEMLSKLRPSPAEQKQIDAMPKAKRKQYVKEHYPYYRNEIKQALNGINVTWFEDRSMGVARNVERDLLCSIVDEAVARVRKDVFILQQSVKRSMGRWHDAEGNHMKDIELKSVIYTTYLMWKSVCILHDQRMALGATPIGKDLTDDTREYLNEWIRDNIKGIENNEPIKPSRYYDPMFESAMHKMRPTAILDAMTLITNQVVGWHYDPKDPMNGDIPFSASIIVKKCGNVNFAEELAHYALEETGAYKVEREWIEKYCQEVKDGPELSLSQPLFEATNLRLEGLITTDDILKLVMKKYSLGVERFKPILAFMLWLETQLPPAKDTLANLRKVAAEAKKKTEKPQFPKGMPYKIPTPPKRQEPLSLTPPPPEPRRQMARWSDADTRWLRAHWHDPDMTIVKAQKHLQRTAASIYSKVRRVFKNTIEEPELYENGKTS